MSDKKHIIFDIEVAPNGFLVGFLDSTSLEVEWLDDNDADLESKLCKLARFPYTLVGFNSMSFDMPVLAAIVEGRTPREVKRIADRIIEENMWPWKAYREFNLRPLLIDHVDLREVAPSFVSLKAYGARMNSRTIRDLPYDHRLDWTPEMREDIRTYCYNDLKTTLELFQSLEGELKLREQISEQYKIDCRSLSDTQMAGAIFDSKLNLRRKANKIPSMVDYQPPAYLNTLMDPELVKLRDAMRDHTFVVDGKTGHVKLPKHLEKAVEFAGGVYQPGVGGLHSKHDKKVCYVAGKEYILAEVDAASFYPSIIIQNQLSPAGLGYKFISVYKDIYDARMKAKKSGDSVTNESLKISLNGSFGLTAAKHSTLYDPAVMLYITLTGQLTLLQLIERLNLQNIACLSANTDGIVVMFEKDRLEEAQAVVNEYEKDTGYNFEWTRYKSIAYKDCNNYFAVGADGKIKRKGLYAKPGLRKNLSAPICSDAVALWLATGKPLSETIREGRVVDYLSARNVTGGGMQADKYLGKVVRWYNTTRRDLPPITYATNGNKVPKTDGARECMTIRSFEVLPPDLDFEWYLKEAVKIVADVGAAEYLKGEYDDYLCKPKKIVRGARKNG